MENQDLKISLYPSQLRIPTENVSNFDNSIKNLIDKMYELLLKYKGLGLASNQVGNLIKLFITNIPREGLRCYINPFINKVESKELKLIWSVEGCLSIPGFQLKIKRFPIVTIEYQDLNGRLITERANGLKAIVLQHEFDHICGKTIIDRLDKFSDKSRVMGEFLKLKKQGRLGI